jgi:hypothetical protein
MRRTLEESVYLVNTYGNSNNNYITALSPLVTLR